MNKIMETLSVPETIKAGPVLILFSSLLILKKKSPIFPIEF